MSFDALEYTLDAIRHLRSPLTTIAQRDPDLARQLRRAAETVTCLRVAEAWGDLDAAALSAPLALLDRVRAMLWRLTH